jgi:hypothetical protein
MTSIPSFEQAEGYFKRTPMNTRSSYWNKKPKCRPLSYKLSDQSVQIREVDDNTYELVLYHTALITYHRPRIENGADTRLVEFGYNGGYSASTSTLDFLHRHGFSERVPHSATCGRTVRIVPGGAGHLTIVDGKVDLSRSKNGRFYTKFTHPSIIGERAELREQLWPLCMQTAMGVKPPTRWVASNGAEVGHLLREYDPEWSEENMAGFLNELHAYARRVWYDAGNDKFPDDLAFAKQLCERALNEAYPLANSKKLQPEWVDKMPAKYWYTTTPDSFDAEYRAEGA